MHVLCAVMCVYAIRAVYLFHSIILLHWHHISLTPCLYSNKMCTDVYPCVQRLIFIVGLLLCFVLWGHLNKRSRIIIILNLFCVIIFIFYTRFSTYAILQGQKRIEIITFLKSTTFFVVVDESAMKLRWRKSTPGR